MSAWRELNVEDRVVEVLADVPLVNPGGHEFGRPFITAYQLAIEIERRWPEILQHLGHEVGGRGSGSASFARYVANQLSLHLPGRVEGAFISNRDVVDFRFRRADGTEIVSSSSGLPQDLSMFRLRRIDDV